MKKHKLLILSVLLLIGCSKAVQSSSASSSDSSSFATSNEINTVSDLEQDTTTSKETVSSKNETTTEEKNTTSENQTSSKNTSSSSSKNNSSSSKNTTSSESSIPTSGGEYNEPINDDIFLSPTGSDSNLGTKESPLFNLNTAINKLTPGHTIFMLPGTYSYDKQVLISDSKDGTEDKPYKIQAYDWQEVVLDFSSQPWGNNSSNYVGIYLKGDYWKIQGITVFCAGDNGIKIEGSHNYIGRCITHHNFDTGIQLGFGHHDENPTGELCAYNVIENCDSYLNYDYHGKGGNADGFACKMHNGKENYFIGCRSWNNSDDAWDLYETDYAVHLIDCWAWNSGEDINFTTDEIFTSQEIANKKSAGGNKVSPVTGCQGNGNGIKLGGNGEGGDSKGIHTATNCVVFECDDAGDSVKGFDENSHKGGIVLENCVSFDNCKNYMFENGGSNSSFKNNISFQTENCRKGNATRPGEIGTSAKLENNNFVSDGGDLLINKDMVFTADDFITIKEEDALAPRQQDGSLPNNGFCRIKETSKFYNSGMGLK